MNLQEAVQNSSLFLWPQQRSEKQQDPRDIGLPVFTICSSDHCFQRFHWNVFADMTAVYDGCKHAIPGG